VIIEDVRGRYASEGEWYPFKNEMNDGYDTVEWAAALPYASGKVGMFSGSYDGATQMLAAIGRPPHLAGLFSYVTPSNYHENSTYQGGAFEQWFSESWSSKLARDTFNRANQKRVDALNGAATLPLVDYPIFGLQQLPSQATTTKAFAPYFLDWLDQRLLVIVGGHAGNGPKIGALDFGKDSNFDEDETTIHWYDYLFKGALNEFSSGKPVSIFVLGTNKYRQEDEWPLSRAKSTRYFLHSTGAANGHTPSGSRQGSGSLSVIAPSAEKPDQYIYDPSDPVQTIGGPLCCGALRTCIGPQDQRPAEARSDVLIYTTPAFSKATEIPG
jgi:predicted acyl esterase